MVRARHRSVVLAQAHQRDTEQERRRRQKREPGVCLVKHAFRDKNSGTTAHEDLSPSVSAHAQHRVGVSRDPQIDIPVASPAQNGAIMRIGLSDGPVAVFSTSSDFETKYPRPHMLLRFLPCLTSFSAPAAAAASGAFSLRSAVDPAAEGAWELLLVVGAKRWRLPQTILMSFCSKSLQVGIIWSVSYAQTTRTRSSRWRRGSRE